MNIGSYYELLDTLGQGGEGTVYLARNRTTGDRIVLKSFHKPVPFNMAEGLRFYAERVNSNEYGLSRITLCEGQDQIHSLEYSFVPLYDVHWRIFFSFESIAQTLLGAFCRMQSYLMSRHGLGLTDTTLHHFMLAGDGRFHFVDYGIHIEAMNHAWTLERGLFGYGFAMMLLSLYNINIKFKMLPVSDYSYDTPCSYCQIKELDVIGSRHKWVREIVSEIRKTNASIFLNPEFYLQLAERLPNRVQFPGLTIKASKSLYFLRQLFPPKKTED